ncbi:unnamed protein product [Prunus armeniaca]
MMFPKFWTQYDIDCSMEFDNSGSYEVRSEMQWLVYCILLSIGFHSKLAKLLLPSYYDVPQVLDSRRYRLVREIGQFSFGLNTISIGPWNWTIQFYPLDFTKNSTNYSSLYVVMFPKFWTQYDIDWSLELDNSGSYEGRSEMEWLVYRIILSIGFLSKLPKSLLPSYYYVPQVLDSIRYRLVHDIGRFRFV